MKRGQEAGACFGDMKRGYEAETSGGVIMRGSEMWAYCSDIQKSCFLKAAGLNLCVVKQEQNDFNFRFRKYCSCKLSSLQHTNE